MYDADTIAAIATPPGPGGIGVVRVSGPQAARLADAVFRRRSAGAWETHRLYHGRIVDGDGAALDDGARRADARAAQLHRRGRARAALPRQPGRAAARACSALLARGARPARAGEFTKRAFLNGKLDLAQAEAVAELVRARTADAAQRRRRPALRRPVGAPRGAARAAHPRQGACSKRSIDFSDEDVGLDDAALARRRSTRRSDGVAALLAHLRARRVCCATACASPSSAGPTSANRACSTPCSAPSAPSSRREPGTTRDVHRGRAPTSTACRSCSSTPPACATTGDAVERIGVDRAAPRGRRRRPRPRSCSTPRGRSPRSAALARPRATPIAVLNKMRPARALVGRDELAALDAPHPCRARLRHRAARP